MAEQQPESQSESGDIKSYSVSFCDNIILDTDNMSDSTPLLDDISDDEVESTTRQQNASSSIQNESPMFIKSPPNSTNVRNVNDNLIQSSCYSSSCPVSSRDSPECNACYSRGSIYGKSSGKEMKDSLQKTPTQNGVSPHRIVYCIHGKPSGCCVSVLSNSTPNKQDGVNTIILEDEDHCHKERNHVSDKKARRKLLTASILCLIFMVCEIIGGVLSGSLAIATDASHLLTDFASFMISLFALWVASRPPTKQMPFGWYRAEVLGALISVLLIWVVTGILCYIAIERIIQPDFDIKPDIMLYTSIFGLIVNVLMGCTLHQHSHSHGGGGTGQNINVRAAFIHVLGDFIQSFGVFVAALVIYFKPEWKFVDPICTFLFAILVLGTTFTIIRDTMVVLMEGIPKGVDFTDVLNTFLCIDGVIKVHNLRIWALSLDKTALSAHLAVKPGVNTNEILKRASRLIHDKFNFFEMTLQIEEFNTQMDDCLQCQSPEQ